MPAVRGLYGLPSSEGGETREITRASTYAHRFQSRVGWHAPETVLTAVLEYQLNRVR